MADVEAKERPGLLARLSRLLLAVIFVSGGFDSVRNPGPKVPRVAQAGVPRPKLSTQVNGLAMVVAGMALGLGIKPKLAAGVLAASLIPTTLAGHRFWELEGKQAAQQQIHFMKNLGLLGGLIGVLASRR
ncbi:MAG: DoxX family protein [Nitriliruptorales bacterium]